MKTVLFILNLLLIAAAVMLTIAQINHKAPPIAPVVLDASEIQTGPDKPRREAFNPPLMTADQTDPFWEKNLFHPERIFEEEKPEAKPDAPSEVPVVPATPEDYELVMISRFGEKAYASIIVRMKDVRPTRSPIRVQHGRHTTPTPPVPGRPPTSRTPQNKRERGKILTVGDAVGEGGYKLTEIKFTSVLMQKEGAADIELTINRQDEASISRIATIQKEAELAEKQQAAEAAKQAALERLAEKRKEMADQAAAQKEMADQAAVPNEEAENDPTSRTPPPPPPPPPGFGGSDGIPSLPVPGKSGNPSLPVPGKSGSGTTIPSNRVIPKR